MEKHIIVTKMQKTNLKSLSRFIQILDGSFPSGVFVHSFGLEPHVLKEKVKDINSLKIYLENLIFDQYSKINLLSPKIFFTSVFKASFKAIYIPINSP